ncbi:acidic leucine-rich nuclear phosphoprotein 32 family member B [Rhodamnia argentea]|uniref:Acidic leucine-rich nuclear phosphoprotein 32 family member B n=1 Tax=Rhodamnia argentea TaxID=178133 RepID=A0A8B8PXP4_9MYRT|nr:acidic leucine-rich nuclear phosphoprotein 32 family member B [Rhodamnia argentea]
MANTENREEFAFPAKRKPDLPRRETEGVGGGGDRSSKSLKLEPLENLNHTGGNDEKPSESGDGNAHGEGNHSGKALVPEEKPVDADAPVEVEEEEEEEEDGDYDDDDEEEDDDDDDDEEEEDAGDAGGEVYVKGKGTLKDDKGKGKMIVEEEDEDSGDSSSDDYGSVGVPSESDSDLSDDPLAEVDMDNILPSRTRQRTARPGVFIAGDRKDGGDDRS